MTDAPSCSTCSRLVVGSYEWGHGIGCGHYAWCKGSKRGPSHNKGLREVAFKGVGYYYQTREVIGESAPT